MKNEYLITFDIKQEVCSDISDFKKLLQLIKGIKIVNDNKLSYNDIKFDYTITSGNLPDNSVYYNLCLEKKYEDENLHIEEYDKLLKNIRKICSTCSGRQVIVLYDGVGEFYCKNAYPIIFNIENIMRKLISKFMAISIGYDWSKSTTPSSVKESIRSKNNNNDQNILLEVDFIQLSKFLFTDYTQKVPKKYIESLKKESDDHIIRKIDLENFIPYNNWEKYFENRVDVSSEYIETRWERLYDLRNKIAHCRGINKSEFEELKSKSDEIIKAIEEALNSIDNLELDDEERDQLAENLTGSANEESFEFLSRYNILSDIVKGKCENISEENDVYRKHETNKSNIRMQADFLSKHKNIITMEERECIYEIHSFRNMLVHRSGLMAIDKEILKDHLNKLDDLIYSLKKYD